MAVKLFDSELKVMDVLWKEGDLPAKTISDILKAAIGWNMNTTYTAITDAFLYFIIASILSSIASLLKWLYMERHLLRASSMLIRVRA